MADMHIDHEKSILWINVSDLKSFKLDVSMMISLELYKNPLRDSKLFP